MTEYKKLLKKARKEMPESVFLKERFEIPKVKGQIQGNKTIINNFMQIVHTLGRPTEHIVKYLLRRLAAPGGLKGHSLIIGAKIAASKVNETIRNYANEYVLCQDCGKPDTKIEKEGNATFLKCTACGAREPIKGTV